MPKTLLLADDSVVIQKLVGLSFANEDVEIVATDNGDDAIAKAREVQPDVILADVVMPGKSGYEVCEVVKQDPALAGVPVLLLTGTFEAFDEGEARRAGADGQITKPFEAQALVDRVKEVLNRPAPVAAPTAAQPSPAAADNSANAAAAQSASNEAYDFFDQDVSNLTPAGPDVGSEISDSALAPDLSEAIPSDPATVVMAGDPGASGLFGAPGDGSPESIAESDGGLALGSSFEPAASNSPESPPSFAPVETAPPPLPLPTPPAMPEAPVAEETVAIIPDAPPVAGFAGDPLASFSNDLPMDDPLSMPGASAVDLDLALEAADPGGEATILVGGMDADVNASTSPNIADAGIFPPTTDPALASEPSGAEPMPSDLERARGEASFSSNPAASAREIPAPVASPDAFTETGGPAVVADLDNELDLAMTPPPIPTSAAPSTPESGAPSQPHVSTIANDLDFGFDVSEQVRADSGSDALDTSFSLDIDPATLDSLASSLDASADLDPIAPGYDVSSSELLDPTDPSTSNPLLPPDPMEDPVATPFVAPESPNTLGGAGQATPDMPPRFEDTGAPLVGVGSDVIDLDPGLGPDLDAGFDIVADATDTTDEMAGEALIEVAEETQSPLAGDGEAPEVIALPGREFETPIVGVTTDSDRSDPVTSSDSEDNRVADLSPMMEQRITETLEKIAWEAFSDLSESIVKQILGRVEKIAWEVIPEMTETLVREEIRKMKGEED